jgi:hypothetical protein
MNSTVSILILYLKNIQSLAPIKDVNWTGLSGTGIGKAFMLEDD